MEKIFTGHVPLEGVTNKRQIPRKIWKGTRPSRPDRLSPSWNRGLNQNIWSLMTRCWHKRPEKRPSLAQIIHILESTAPGDTRPLDAGSSSDLAPSAFRRRMSDGSNFIDLETLKDIVGPRGLNPRATKQRNHRRSLSLSGVVGPYKLNPRATEPGNDPSSLSLSVQRLTMSENAKTLQTLFICVKDVFTQLSHPHIPLYIKRIDQINDELQAGGSYGDIYKGLYQERVVALKLVRTRHSRTKAKVRS
ncbi:hypothetical protein H0H93_000320 [Arthromyces matolae]|nr:hypothetical protein H0H93_000320 [Arthromyces matolae]